MSFLKAQWDLMLPLALAVVVTVLSLFDWWVDADAVPKWTLAVLALLCGTIVKDRLTRAKDAAEAKDIKETLVALEGRLSGADEIQAVPADAISRRFASAFPSTTRWRFKGGTGTYLRAKTLPGLAIEKRSADVWAEIIAPDELKVCDRYGRLRRMGPDALTSAGGAARWSTEEVRIQSYATIVAAIWYSEHTSVHVHVGLTSIMSTIRQDMSDDFVLVTNEFPHSRALSIVSSGTGRFYESSKRELEISFDQTRQLVLENLSLPRNKITGPDVLRVLKEVGNLHHDEAFLTGEVCANIALKAISKDHATILGFEEGGADDPYPITRR